MTVKLPGKRKQRDEYLPREIVEFLDKYIIGQKEAKRAVAKALRNRFRQRKVTGELSEEIYPKNIVMIGSTGIGKTEIARRLSKITRSPFIKVEASKFTETGYVGRDVESMIRNLTENAVNMIRDEKIEKVKEKARKNTEERLLKLLLPSSRHTSDTDSVSDELAERRQRTREKLLEDLRAGKLEDREVTVKAQSNNVPAFEIISGSSIEEMNMNLQDMMSNMFSDDDGEKTMTVEKARDFILKEEQDKLMDQDRISEEAVERTEKSGIVFIDEIDKVSGRESKGGPDVSREGVQRDILPIVEGTTVKTKHGMVKTDHILFIAAGAFHVSKPSDMIPELQGRFPIRVELKKLTRDDFIRILKEPQNSLIKQYKALMDTEDINLEFTDGAIKKIADFAFRVNESTENIGARRLQTVMETLLDEISFEGPELEEKTQVVDSDYVEDHLAEIIGDEDLSRYIL